MDAPVLTPQALAELTKLHVNSKPPGSLANASGLARQEETETPTTVVPRLNGGQSSGIIQHLWSLGCDAWPGTLSIDVAALLVEYHRLFDPVMGRHLQSECLAAFGLTGVSQQASSVRFKTHVQSDAVALSLVLPMLQPATNMIIVMETGGLSRLCLPRLL